MESVYLPEAVEFITEHTSLIPSFSAKDTRQLPAASVYPILYFMEATFIMLHYMQQTAKRQEENIKTMSSYSVMNEKELYSESSKVTFVSHMILYILCMLIGLIGRIPFFSMICNKIFKIFNRTFDIVKSFKTEKRKFDLVVDIQEKMAQGKNGGYVQWAKKYNVKQFAESILFLQQHDIHDKETLDALVDGSSTKYHELMKTIKDAEEKMAANKVIKTHIINYAKTRETYIAYRKSGYSKKFYEAHRGKYMTMYIRHFHNLNFPSYGTQTSADRQSSVPESHSYSLYLFPLFLHYYHWN